MSTKQFECSCGTVWASTPGGAQEPCPACGQMSEGFADDSPDDKTPQRAREEEIVEAMALAAGYGPFLDDGTNSRLRAMLIAARPLIERQLIEKMIDAAENGCEGMNMRGGLFTAFIRQFAKENNIEVDGDFAESAKEDANTERKQS